jgi:DNA repair exonuclease SbcCD nuclease subunit
MKILFTADWHIKLGQKTVPESWQINRYRMLVDNINSIDCDYMIIAGDLFDRIPTLAELSLWFDISKNIKHKTFIIDGNHEALRKGSTFLSMSIFSNTNRISYITDHFCNEEFQFIPYCKLQDTKITKAKRNILVTHVRGNLPPHVKAEIELDVYNKWDLVLAGDLHHYHKQENIRYPGSPLTTSYSKDYIDKYIILFDTDTFDHEVIYTKLPALITKQITNKDELAIIKEDTFNNIKIEYVGSKINAIDIEGQDIIKKYIKESSESKLDLLSSNSIQEELRLYFKHNNLPEPDIDKCIGVFNDFI